MIYCRAIMSIPTIIATINERYNTNEHWRLSLAPKACAVIPLDPILRNANGQ